MSNQNKAQSSNLDAVQEDVQNLKDMSTTLDKLDKKLKKSKEADQELLTNIQTAKSNIDTAVITLETTYKSTLTKMYEPKQKEPKETL